MSEKMRLDKFLSDMLKETRTKVKEYIKKGRVKVNDATWKADAKVDLKADRVTFDGKALTYTSVFYYMLHKPAGVITSTEHGRTETVMDVLIKAGLDCPFFEKLSPVGRLDKDTEGLLLITNDGELTHRLLSPKKHVNKVYYVKLDLPPSEEDKRAFEEGVVLSDFTAMPAGLSFSDEKNACFVTIREGKFHQVKRMFQAVGKEVLYLKRISMGSLRLDEHLSPGEYRDLTKEEITALKKECGLYDEKEEKI